MADPVKSPIIASLTGAPKAETLARYGAAMIGAAAVGVAVGWAKAHGYKIPDADTIKLYVQGVGGLVLMIWATMLGFTAMRKSEQAVIQNTVQAALTGEVPAAIMAKASPEQAKAVEDAPNASVADKLPATVK